MTEVKTDTNICPDLVDPTKYGHHRSVVKDGIRVWQFTDPEGLLKFAVDIAWHPEQFMRKADDRGRES